MVIGTTSRCGGCLALLGSLAALRSAAFHTTGHTPQHGTRGHDVTRWSSPPGRTVVQIGTRQPTSDVMETLVGDGRFGRMVSLLRDTKLDPELIGAGPVTILAPTDDALDDERVNVTLAAASKNSAILRRVISYHVLPGRVGLKELVEASDASTRVRTLEKSGVAIGMYSGALLVDEARVVQWNIEASNGVIHVVDNLLMPYIVGFDPYEDVRKAMVNTPIVGVTPPLGLFDPLKLWEGKTNDEQDRLRRAEVKHSRVAMLAATGVLVQEQFHPVLNWADPAPATLHMQLLGSQAPLALVAPLLAVGAAEAYELARSQGSSGSAASPSEYFTRMLERESARFEDKRKQEQQDVDMQNKELNNGRLAMVAWLGMMAQELATGRTLLDWL